MTHCSGLFELGISGTYSGKGREDIKIWNQTFTQCKELFTHYIAMICILSCSLAGILRIYYSRVRSKLLSPIVNDTVGML
jgi:hypothetical protein